MVTSPLLSNVHHRAMITPISLLLTRLIHISPSCWTIYCSSEVILDMGTYLGLDLKSNIQLYTNPLLQGTFSPIRIMFQKIQYLIAQGSSGSKG